MYRIILCLFLLQFSISTAQTVQYTMPSEESLHEGTWLQWPHDYTYNFGASDFEPTWIEMTEALITGENVHIIAYNEEEKNHIEYILGISGLSMENINIFIIPNDDFG